MTSDGGTLWAMSKERTALVAKATGDGPCRNGRCGYGRIIDWKCAAKGTVDPFHSFDCPHHPGATPPPLLPTPRHCDTCACEDK